MKFLVSQLEAFLSERQARRNLRALLKYLLFVVAVVAAYSVAFHFLMKIEGQDHSWLTGVYWTLTVMSTLGFGDITFHSDVGRLFSLAVLLSGVVLLLIMLPFAFIRYFYAPWLEAQIRSQAPREVPPRTRDHVILCRWDSIAPGLVERLKLNRVPYFVLEPDPVAAASLAGDGISVVIGEFDSRVTYERLRVAQARMVLVNAEDMTNTNITLTIREIHAEVPIVALAEDEDSIDILELSGATHVLPLKRKLGEHLAARVATGADSAHLVGTFEDLQIVEFIVHGTQFVGQKLRETRLRELTGVNVVGAWQQGSLQPVHPDLVLRDATVPVAVGTPQQIERLNDLLGETGSAGEVVLVIGCGKVGRAAASALKRRGVPVHVVEKNERLRRKLKDFDQLVIGDAADRAVLRQAGLERAGAVALTTNNDAVNVHLAVYCRRLKPDLDIVSRITRSENVEAIYRAGADYALSYASLGREYVLSLLHGRSPVMLGEGADLFFAVVPESLAGETLGESHIGARTGLIVIAVENGEEVRTNPGPETPLPAGGRLLMLGTPQQRQAFASEFD